MLLIAAGSILLKRCESKSELEHQKYEKYVLQFVCLMQTGINGCEIYKNVSMMHAIVFADRALEANRARDSSHRRFLMGPRGGKIAIRTTKRATRASQMGKKGSSLGLSGGKRVMCLIGSAKIRFAKMCSPQQREAYF